MPSGRTHDRITFLLAHNDSILLFEKATPSRDNVLVVAINLDPHNEQGADIELSRATFEHWHLHDHANLEVIDQMNGTRFEWQGRWQHVRLDPGRTPFAIWRIAPVGGLPRPEPDWNESAASEAADADTQQDPAIDFEAGFDPPKKGAK